MVGILGMIAFNLVDTFFIGQLGMRELAAISFTFPIAFLVTALTMGLGIGTSSVCSRLFGAQKHEQVERVAIHAVCGEGVFWEHLEALKAAGASAILVLPVEKMLA